MLMLTSTYCGLEGYGKWGQAIVHVCVNIYLHTMVEVIGVSPKVTRSHYVHIGIEKRVAIVIKVS